MSSKRNRKDRNKLELDSSFTNSNEMEDKLNRLMTGMVALQESVEKLTINVDHIEKHTRELEKTAVPSSAANNLPEFSSVDSRQTEIQIATVKDRNYISNWKELRGTNLVFYQNTKFHPMAFLKKLNKIFIEAGVPDDCKLGLAVTCLRGAAADWIAIKESSFNSFQDFTTAFTDRFWSVDKQRDLVLDLHYGRYESGSRSDYFLNLISQASFLTEKITTAKLIEIIAKHFSPDIQRGIITNGFATIDDVESFLQKIDDSYKVDPTDNSNRNPRRNNNNYREAPITRSNANSANHSRNQNERRDESRVEQARMSYITVFNRDTEELLTDSDEDLEENEMVAPTIIMSVGNRNIEVLLDNGSEVCAISESFYFSLKGGSEDIPVLPVTNVTIAVAVGGKTQRVKNQILLPVSISGQEMDVTCLVVPFLNCNVIFGANWLYEHKTIIDFEKSQLRFHVDNQSILTNIDFKVNGAGIHIVLYTNLCKNLSDGAEISSNTENGAVKANTHKYSLHDLRKAADDAMTDDSHKEKLFIILKENRNVFSECPGRVNCYTHEIELNDYEAFNAATYPIPFKYREGVTNQIREMIAWDVIQKEKTEYISPLVCVTIKDGSVRVCLDARWLNSKMKKNFINPPNPNELLFSFKKPLIQLQPTGKFQSLKNIPNLLGLFMKGNHTPSKGYPLV
ncbi:uncharacterized protein [Leptinotarsa decemlineata]|uniref:uncharacterized protein n=1 Tax=Leptinotarsa decemlineata TaxID=7539 RepID=UPI003D30BF69